MLQALTEQDSPQDIQAQAAANRADITRRLNEIYSGIEGRPGFGGRPGLAGEYLRAFGPARPEDFRWWAGVPKGRASAALATVETVEPEGGYLLRAEDLGAFVAAGAPDPGAVDILPKWDCYTMGYAPDGRGRFVHPDVQGRVYTTAGDGLGVVLVGGAAAGAWEARFSGGAMEVRLDVFEPPGAKLKGAIEAGFGEVAASLGAREVRLA